MVTVEVPVLPAEMVALLALNVKLLRALATVNVTLPLEAAYVESPE
jgi:hypothetical protein